MISCFARPHPTPCHPSLSIWPMRKAGADMYIYIYSFVSRQVYTGSQKQKFGQTKNDDSPFHSKWWLVYNIDEVCILVWWQEGGGGGTVLPLVWKSHWDKFLKPEFIDIWKDINLCWGWEQFNCALFLIIVYNVVLTLAVHRYDTKALSRVCGPWRWSSSGLWSAWYLPRMQTGPCQRHSSWFE